jgi:hypothetical protein
MKVLPAEIYKAKVEPGTILEIHPELEIYYNQDNPVKWDECKIESWMVALAFKTDEQDKSTETVSTLNTLVFFINGNEQHYLLSKKSINEQVFEFDKKMKINHRYIEYFFAEDVDEHTLIIQNILLKDLKTNTAKMIY